MHYWLDKEVIYIHAYIHIHMNNLKSFCCLNYAWSFSFFNDLTNSSFLFFLQVRKWVKPRLMLSCKARRMKTAVSIMRVSPDSFIVWMHIYIVMLASDPFDTGGVYWWFINYSKQWFCVLMDDNIKQQERLACLHFFYGPPWWIPLHSL